MNISGQPGLDEIEERFVAVLDGGLSRDEADRWAARWLADEDLVWDDPARWALDHLHGIDLPAGPNGDFLHDEEQVREWLRELRRRRHGCMKARPCLPRAIAPARLCRPKTNFAPDSPIRAWTKYPARAA